MKIYLLIFVSGLLGCSTNTPLPEINSGVKISNQKPGEDCKKLGEFDMPPLEGGRTFGASMGAQRSKVRVEAQKLKANYVFSDGSKGFAYYCP